MQVTRVLRHVGRRTRAELKFFNLAVYLYSGLTFDECPHERKAPNRYAQLNKHHRMRRILAVLVFTALTSVCFGQMTPQEISNRFFDTYKLGDTDKAIDYLFSNSPYAKEIAEGIEDVKRQLKKTSGQIGKFYGADLLSTRTAGASLIMLTYLVRHDREPLVFNIMFYRPNDKWQMQNFKYGNSIDDELEEASKAYRLKENFE